MAIVERLLRRFYNGLILRDIVGHAVPGFVSLGMINLALGPQLAHIFPPGGSAGSDGPSGLWGLVLFGIVGFVWGWVLHALHFGALRLANLLSIRLAKRSLWSEPSPAGEQAPPDSAAITRADLQPEATLIATLTPDALRERLAGVSGLDRLQALMALSGNLATAIALGTPFLVVSASNLFLTSGGILSKIGLVAVLVFAVIALILIAVALYAEFWRLWKARDWLTALYAAQATTAK